MPYPSPPHLGATFFRPVASAVLVSIPWPLPPTSKTHNMVLYCFFSMATKRVGYVDFRTILGQQPGEQKHAVIKCTSPFCKGICPFGRDICPFCKGCFGDQIPLFNGHPPMGSHSLMDALLQGCHVFSKPFLKGAMLWFLPTPFAKGSPTHHFSFSSWRKASTAAARVG